MIRSDLLNRRPCDGIAVLGLWKWQAAERMTMTGVETPGSIRQSRPAFSGRRNIGPSDKNRYDFVMPPPVRRIKVTVSRSSPIARMPSEASLRCLRSGLPGTIHRRTWSGSNLATSGNSASGTLSCINVFCPIAASNATKASRANSPTSTGEAATRVTPGGEASATNSTISGSARPQADLAQGKALADSHVGSDITGRKGRRDNHGARI